MIISGPVVRQSVVVAVCRGAGAADLVVAREEERGTQRERQEREGEGEREKKEERRGGGGDRDKIGLQGHTPGDLLTAIRPHLLHSHYFQ